MANSKSSSTSLLSLPSSASKVAIIGDIHIGIHDDSALRVLVECFEREGVDFVVANGDIHDCAAISRHAGKAALARIETGQLAEEIEGGRWFVDWLNTRPCIYGEGNHEAWINQVATQNGATGSITVASVLRLPVSEHFQVAPSGYQIRAGNLVIEHGDALYPRSGGPLHLAAGILRRFPDQTTIIGHCHRQDASWYTTVDNRGTPRSHAAFAIGHVSQYDKHQQYAGRAPNWQQGAAIVNLWEDAGKRRFTVSMIEVHRDRRNRPIFEFNGKIYR